MPKLLYISNDADEIGEEFLEEGRKMQEHESYDGFLCQIPVEVDAVLPLSEVVRLFAWGAAVTPFTTVHQNDT